MIDKYSDVEKTYRTSIDNWLCNMYFSIKKKDTLANPYTVQLVLDADTQERHARLQKAQELKAAQMQRQSVNDLHGEVVYGM